MNKLNQYAGMYVVYGDNEQLYFEHGIHGEDRSCCIYLDEEGNIYDYDMCHTIPTPVGQWLRNNGYNVEYRRDKHGAYWDYV